MLWLKNRKTDFKGIFLSISDASYFFEIMEMIQIESAKFTSFILVITDLALLEAVNLINLNSLQVKSSTDSYATISASGKYLKSRSSIYVKFRMMFCLRYKASVGLFFATLLMVTQAK